MNKIIVSALTAFLIIFISSGCGLAGLIGQEPEVEIENIPIIEIDETEIELIKNIDERLETSYEMSKDTLSSEEVSDPFRPYYLGAEEEKENTLFLEQIYSDDGAWYAEVKFNEFLYKLTPGDIFANIYKLEVVHENSVVLLKGDEIITLSLGQLLYD